MMSTVRLRAWASGAFTATERAQGGQVRKVLEFDSRQRYHLVSVDGSNWSETDFRFDMRPSTRKPSFFFKRSKSEPGGRILTTWQTVTRSGAKTSGETLIHADNMVTWSQETKSKGTTIFVEGSSSTRTRKMVDSTGQVVSLWQQQTSAPLVLGTEQTTRTDTDGSTSTTTVEHKRASDGGQLTRTTTTQTDASGQATSQVVQITKQNTDQSVVTQTKTTDYVGGTETFTVTYTNGSSSQTDTTVTDTTTGESVTTSDTSSTFTDAQGNTITQDTSSVTSSDGFSSAQTTWSSSNGSSGYESATTDGQGNTVFEHSETDANGNTTTMSVESDGSQVTVTTTATDSSGNGTQTTSIYDAKDGTLLDSTTQPVSDTGGGDSGGGDGGGGDSGGGSSGMANPDDGTDEGPRNPTGRVGMGQGKTAPGIGNAFGGEGDPRNVGIGQYLQSYADATDQNGWGDASSENAPSRPPVDVVVNMSAADDDWGNLNNPRALTGFAQSLLVAATQGSLGAASIGLQTALVANSRISAQIVDLAID